jgi:hypothetical protein
MGRSEKRKTKGGKISISINHDAINVPIIHTNEHTSSVVEEKRGLSHVRYTGKSFRKR